MAKSTYAIARLAELAAAPPAPHPRRVVRDIPPEPRRDSPIELVERRLSPYQLTLDQYLDLYRAHNGQCRLCGAIARSIIPNRFSPERSRRGPGAGTAQIVRLHDGLTIVCRRCYTGLKLFELSPERLRAAADLCAR